MKVVRASLALNDVIVPLDLISFAYVVYGRLIHIAKWSEISMRMRSMGTHTHAQRAHSTSTAPRLRLFFCLFLTHLANIRFGSFFLFFFSVWDKITVHSNHCVCTYLCIHLCWAASRPTTTAGYAKEVKLVFSTILHIFNCKVCQFNHYTNERTNE